MRVVLAWRHVAAVVVVAFGVSLAPIAPATAGTSRNGLPACTTIDSTASSCTLPAGASTTSGALDAVAAAGTLSATVRKGSGAQAWPTASSAVSYLHFQVPAGQTVATASVDLANTTCTMVAAKKNAQGTTVAVSSNGINVNNITCVDGNTLVLNTTSSGVALAPGTVTNGVVLQYKTTDPRSTKTSLWRVSGDYVVSGGCTNVLATDSSPTVQFSGPTAVLADGAQPGLPAGDLYQPYPATFEHPNLSSLVTAGCYTATYYFHYDDSDCVSWLEWPTAGGGGGTCGGNWAYLALDGPRVLVPTGGSLYNDSFKMTLIWTGTGGPITYDLFCCT